MPYRDPQRRLEAQRRRYAENHEAVLEYRERYRKENSERVNKVAKRAHRARRLVKVRGIDRTDANDMARRFRTRGAFRIATSRSTTLWERNARQAWRWWLAHKAPGWWLDAYYAAKPTRAELWIQKYRSDAAFVCMERVRSSMTKHLRRRGVVGITFATLGYSAEQLRDHIERQFTPGMTWTRFMQGEIRITHKLAISAFPLGADPVLWRVCWCLDNLRPTWTQNAAPHGHAPATGDDVGREWSLQLDMSANQPSLANTDARVAG